MVKSILVLDKFGMAPSLIKGLETELGCCVEVYRELSKVRSCLDMKTYNVGIINPFIPADGISEAYIRFIKQDLKDRNIPVLIFSRVSAEKLALGTEFGLDLRLERDYQAYLRKPASINKLIESVRGLIEG